MKPHHPSLALAEVEAQRVADQAGCAMVVWSGRAVAASGCLAPACWTVTVATYVFPSACAMRRERTFQPRST
jgi:hypothetical protein